MTDEMFTELLESVQQGVTTLNAPCLPTDDDLIQYITGNSGARVVRLCERFSLTYCYSDLDAPKFGYTEQAKSLRNQLQRLRKAQRIISSNGQRWYVR
mgnify:CR=1 FL=1